MPEAQNYIFDYKEIAEVFIKKLDLHEGLWGIYIEFGLGAGIVPLGSSGHISPAAIIPVQKIGIQRFDTQNALTVDAAEVNPLISGPEVGKKMESRRSRTKRNE